MSTINKIKINNEDYNIEESNTYKIVIESSKLKNNEFTTIDVDWAEELYNKLVAGEKCRLQLITTYESLSEWGDNKGSTIYDFTEFQVSGWAEHGQEIKLSVNADHTTSNTSYYNGNLNIYNNGVSINISEQEGKIVLQAMKQSNYNSSSVLPTIGDGLNKISATNMLNGEPMDLLEGKSNLQIDMETKMITGEFTIPQGTYNSSTTLPEGSRYLKWEIPYETIGMTNPMSNLELKYSKTKSAAVDWNSLIMMRCSKDDYNPDASNPIYEISINFLGMYDLYDQCRPYFNCTQGETPRNSDGWAPGLSNAILLISKPNGVELILDLYELANWLPGFETENIVVRNYATTKGNNILTAFKLVDLNNAGNFDSNRIQVLENVNGTLMWVDKE